MKIDIEKSQDGMKQLLEKSHQNKSQPKQFSQIILMLRITNLMDDFKSFNFPTLTHAKIRQTNPKKQISEANNTHYYAFSILA